MTFPNAKKFVLDNGLRILTEEISTLRSVAMGVLVGAGSGNEEPSESGLSHFIEHMSFKGTARRSAYEIAHTLDAVGGKMNAYTSKEYTVYYAVVLDQHIDTAIDVLSDILLNSLFKAEDMEMEKSVVLEEIKMYEDTPDELIHDFFAEKILHGHPLGKPTIGTAEIIKSVQRDDILNYINKWYSPKNIIVSLAGDLPADVIDRLSRSFGNWRSEGLPRKMPAAEITRGLYLKYKKTEQVHLCLGVKGVAQTDEDRYPYALLDSILGGSMSSHLFQEVREKRGLVYSIFSTTSPFHDFGISYVYAGTSKENLKQVIDLILEQYTKFKTEGISQEELERGKEYLKGTLVLGLESTSSRMNWLAKSEFYYGKIKTIDEVFEKIDKVTQEDIIRLANKYFRNEYLTLAVIGDLEELPIKEIRC